MAVSVMLTRSEMYTKGHPLRKKFSHLIFVIVELQLDFPRTFHQEGSIIGRSAQYTLVVQLIQFETTITQKIYTPAPLPITFVLWVLESQA